MAPLVTKMVPSDVEATLYWTAANPDRLLNAEETAELAAAALPLVRAKERGDASQSSSAIQIKTILARSVSLQCVIKGSKPTCYNTAYLRQRNGQRL